MSTFAEIHQMLTVVNDCQRRILVLFSDLDQLQILVKSGSNDPSIREQFDFVKDNINTVLKTLLETIMRFNNLVLMPVQIGDLDHRQIKALLNSFEYVHQNRDVGLQDVLRSFVTKLRIDGALKGIPTYH